MEQLSAANALSSRAASGGRQREQEAVIGLTILLPA
jgi:hypothetical protein